jgi:hypothetical protein
MVRQRGSDLLGLQGASFDSDLFGGLLAHLPATETAKLLDNLGGSDPRRRKAWGG